MRSVSVLVVIPTLNEAHGIGAVLEALARDFDYQGASRIVVVDGGSDDGTLDIVRAAMRRDPRIALLNNARRIQSSAINLAVQSFGEGIDILIRCDAHACYPPRYVARLVEILRRTDSDSVVVPMDSVGVGCTGRAIAWLSDSLIGSGGSAHRGGRRSGYVDHGHHAAFRMQTFRIIGGYDESFRCNEDAEFDCRQRALGARIFLDAGNRITYRPRTSLAALWRQYFNYGAGRSRTVRRHPHSLRLRQLAVPVHSACCLIALAAAHWCLPLLLWPAAYVGALCLNSLTLVMRHRSLCGLGAVAAAITMHFAWSAGFFRSLLMQRDVRWRPSMIAPLAS